MLVSTHVIISFLVALVIYPFFGLYSIIFFLSGFLIDFDHCIEYSISKKDLNPFNAYKHNMDRYRKNKKIIQKGEWNDKIYLHIFHTLEFILLLGILSFFSKIIFFVFLGVLFHTLLDFSSFSYYKIKYNRKVPHSGRHYIATPLVLKKLQNK